MQSRIVNQTGSSPLTRGKRRPRAASMSSTGLIPTHAGKTPWTLTPPTWTTAHPHSRGENFFAEPLAKTGAGSSPLTRGKRESGSASPYGTGLIPTHAGKTRSCPWAWGWSGAHPHSRGENGNATWMKPCLTGSSPLTRGKPAPGGRGNGRAGLIPTHAGKTLPDLRLYRADRSDLGKP